VLPYEALPVKKKLADRALSGAALEGAHADELRQRFAAALLTESDYYAVLQNAELDRVARDRLRRAREQLGWRAPACRRARPSPPTR